MQNPYYYCQLSLLSSKYVDVDVDADVDVDVVVVVGIHLY